VNVHQTLSLCAHKYDKNLKQIIDILPKIINLQKATISVFLCKILTIQATGTWPRCHFFKPQKSFICRADDTPGHILVPGHGGWNSNLPQHHVQWPIVIARHKVIHKNSKLLQTNQLKAKKMSYCCCKNVSSATFLTQKK